LCLQCHRAGVYDTKTHHFHKKKGEKGEPIRSAGGEIIFDVGTGAQCEQCHMPGRYYMGIDYRPDHSFRVPRPDLTTAIGAPNACDRCHADKTSEWSSEHIAKWYGKKYRPHYGTVLEGGRRALPEFSDDLVRLAEDRLFPTIVRATALTLLANFPGEGFVEALQRALLDEEALVRQTALRHADALSPKIRVRLCAPLLYDPVKAVRIEAANALAGPSSESLHTGQREKFRTVLEEYEHAMYHSADFAASRHNLGNLYARLGRIEEAAEQYRKAAEIDDLFYPAKVNLAMLYNQRGENEKAESLLREVVEEHPDLFEVHYSLGLLLAERNNFREAAVFLESASQGLPRRSRIAYNLGLTRVYLKDFAKAEIALLNAQRLEPDNLDFLHALADFYFKRGKPAEAETYARRIVEKHPSWPYGPQLLKIISSMRNRPLP
jgi:Tfp pilus assembly protein PilF